ncbi:MAG TPA: N-6 DNA methylase [Candidatus Hydrogenedentes bacterium]|nr:N-6 DNA methylase [Candidatus Hydrogenedentota bacterium]
MGCVALKSVDFIHPDGRPFPGLVSVRSPKGSLSIHERAAIKDAETFQHIDYIFFRRFNDGRSSQIAAFIVDNSREQLDKQTLAKLHQKIWLNGAAPLLYIAWPSRIDVLACARGADFWNKTQGEFEYNPVNKSLGTALQIDAELKRFSAFRLADGTLWEDEAHRHLADCDKAAHAALIQGVIETDKELQGQKIPELRELLLLVVLIKYLEDRRVFPEQGWFGRWHKGSKSFLDVLGGGDAKEVLRLLEFLENKFNGDVFCLSPKAKKTLTRSNLLTFADLVEAKTIKKQRYLWEQFTFEHLPVEVISHLYQHFVEDGRGAVYTPPFLAALLLDKALPYDTLTENIRILDPACGSGVFLVGAFRRLVNAWRNRHGWEKPNVDTLKKLLRKNIYGVDLDPYAVNLAVFSLSLAVCDALKPDVIWGELKFDKLRETNLLQGDFFSELIKLQDGQEGVLNGGFDVVIGNPPFESTLTDSAKEIESRARKKHKERGMLPDKQAAYLFLEQAVKLLCEDGRSCLIQPASVMHNRKTERFRKNYFRTNQVKAVLDFTSIRNLFEDADVKVVAILTAPLSSPEGEANTISHLTFRRTASVYQRICFELDHYDRHSVPQKLAIDDPIVWRANLLGGGRLLSISQRLRSVRTLKDFIDQQEDWDYGEGFIVAKKGKRNSAPFLTDLPYLPAEALTDSGIDKTMITKVVDTHFRSAYTIKRFSAPLVLIREKESLQTGIWTDGFLTYQNQVVGIHAPDKDTVKLKSLFSFLMEKHTFLKFYCALHGTRSLIAKATSILKKDIDLFPYPEDLQEIALSFWEEILKNDVMNYMLEYVRLGQNSRLLQKSATEQDLSKYSELFVRMLGSVYDNLRSGTPFLDDTLILQPFFFGPEPEIELPIKGDETGFRRLLVDENRHAALRTIRVLRFYDKNVLFLVKPNRLRYWIPSTAIRDADETLTDLHSWGY